MEMSISTRVPAPAELWTTHWPPTDSRRFFRFNKPDPEENRSADAELVSPFTPLNPLPLSSITSVNDFAYNCNRSQTSDAPECLTTLFNDSFSARKRLYRN